MTKTQNFNCIFFKKFEAQLKNFWYEKFSACSKVSKN